MSRSLLLLLVGALLALLYGSWWLLAPDAERADATGPSPGRGIQPASTAPVPAAPGRARAGVGAPGPGPGAATVERVEAQARELASGEPLPPLDHYADWTQAQLRAEAAALQRRWTEAARAEAALRVETGRAPEESVAGAITPDGPIHAPLPGDLRTGRAPRSVQLPEAEYPELYALRRRAAWLFAQARL